MNELVPARFGRENREIGRELGRIGGIGRIERAQVEQATNAQSARVQGVAYVGKQALHATALITEAEQQLSRVVPEASGRLNAIADITALGLAEIVAETVRRVSQ